MLAIQIQSIQNTKITTADLTIRDKIGGIRGRFYRGGRRIDAWPPRYSNKTNSFPSDPRCKGEWRGMARTRSKVNGLPETNANQTNSPPLYETIERKELDKHRASFAATFPFATS